VRAVVTDAAQRILLVHFAFPWETSLPAGLWACPGGGIDPGESVTDALVRELREELGLDIVEPGQPIWRKEHVFAMERWDGQHDTYYWLQVEPFAPRPALTQDELRAENVVGMGWWSYDDLLTAQRAFDEDRQDDSSYTVFSPRRLGHLVRDLFDHGRPSSVVDLDPL